MGTHLAARDPVIVVVLRQLVDLLQRERGAHSPQVWRDVKALQAERSFSKSLHLAVSGDVRSRQQPHCPQPAMLSTLLALAVSR